ncbi:MAG: VOC family protein [Sphingobacteriales bacterium]|nr:VOC family protein [Sphingobacteriales bacterium]
MQDIITGIQQVGIGVSNANEAKHLYKDLFGMNVKIFDDKSPASLMSAYTGNEIHNRHAILTMNLSCGGGFEIWQFTSRTPAMQPESKIGDIGIFAVKIRTGDIAAAHKFYSVNSSVTTSSVHTTPLQGRYFWVKDNLGNRFQIVQCGEKYLSNKFVCGGVGGAVIGVSNIKTAVDFYTNVLGIGKIVFETISSEIVFGKKVLLKKILLQKKRNPNGAFSNLLGDIQIELVQALDNIPAKIFENRYWGDCGLIHLCFDVLDMDKLKIRAENNGYSFSIDSQGSFPMEDAAGRFCYIEDPDGTLIELVETHKIPIIKKIGWHLDLAKRKRNSPLPKWMIRMLGLSKV